MGFQKESAQSEERTSLAIQVWRRASGGPGVGCVCLSFWGGSCSDSSGLCSLLPSLPAGQLTMISRWAAASPRSSSPPWGEMQKLPGVSSLEQVLCAPSGLRPWKDRQVGSRGKSGAGGHPPCSRSQCGLRHAQLSGFHKHSVKPVTFYSCYHH